MVKDHSEETRSSQYWDVNPVPTNPLMDAVAS